MAKNLEICYLLDFYGDVLTEKQRNVLEQYYNDDYSLSEIAENFGITRQGVRDAIKHGESTLFELEEKIGFAKRYRAVAAKTNDLREYIVAAKVKTRRNYASYGIQLDDMFDEMLEMLQTVEEPFATIED